MHKYNLLINNLHYKTNKLIIMQLKINKILMNILILK